MLRTGNEPPATGNGSGAGESFTGTAARAPDFTEQDGYLTPSLKVRRTVVTKDFAADIEALYS